MFANYPEMWESTKAFEGLCRPNIKIGSMVYWVQNWHQCANVSQNISADTQRELQGEPFVSLSRNTKAGNRFSLFCCSTWRTVLGWVATLPMYIGIPGKKLRERLWQLGSELLLRWIEVALMWWRTEFWIPKCLVKLMISVFIQLSLIKVYDFCSAWISDISLKFLVVHYTYVVILVLLASPC